jgi:hypothetical protein
MSSGSPTTLAAPGLAHAFDLSVQVGAPAEVGHTTGATARGLRRVIPILGGTVSGPSVDGVALRGTILPGGADYQAVVSDTVAELDARYLLELEGGERIYVVNRALRRAPADVTARLVRGEAVDPRLVYFRCTPTFEVASPKLRWLTESLFIGTGVRRPDRVELSVYRVL